MQEPSFPDRPRGHSDRHRRDVRASPIPPWLVPGLALGALIAIDAWLAIQLVRSFGALLAELSIPLLPLAAALGCAIMAGTALLATWLLLTDLLLALRSNLS